MNRICIFFKNRSENDKYENVFEQNGFRTAFVPILTNQLFDKKNTLKYLSGDNFLNKIHYFIVTSQRAVESLEICLNELEDSVRQKIFKKKAYAVGPATLQNLLKIGFKDIHGGINAGNAHDLAEMLCKEVAVENKIAFFCGKIRKNVISIRLKLSGYEYDEVVVYETQERNDVFENFKNELHKILNQDNSNLHSSNSLNTQNWLIFFSSQGLKTILDYIKEQNVLKQYQLLENFKIASIGKSTKDFLTKNKIIVDFTSQKPDPVYLLKGITK